MIRGCLFHATLVSHALALALLGARVEAQGLPSTYDLRAVTTGSGVQAWVPAIQDQGIFNDCWTFASATAIESNLLKNGSLSPQPMAPPATISSWHISTRNGAPESLVSTGTYGNSTTDYGWGGFEYQTMGYLTRGQGTWTIPNVPSPQSNYITTMGGGPVSVSGTVNAFPHVLVNNSPANIGYLLPAADQTPAWLTRQVTFLDQGFGGNVPLPTRLEPGKNKYLFNQGAADPQVQAVKNAILAGGAVTTSMNGDWNYFSFTSGTGGLYTVSYVNPGQDPYHTDHEVTIIGWSDSQVVGSGTGAWLVQNSWGTSGWTTSDNPHPNDGTFWASYDDPSIGRTGVASFSMAPTTGYAPTVLQNELGPIGYAYDFSDTTTVLGLAPDQHQQFASVLTPTTSGALAGLGVINGLAGTSLEYSILSGWSAANPSGGTLLASGSYALGGVGYQLIDLATPVPLTANQSIAVLLTYGTAGAAGVVVGGDGLYGVTQVSGSFSYPVNSGLSYYYDTNAATWTDFATKTYTTTSGSISSANTTGGVLFLKGVMVAPVPEPSSLALAAAGLATALWALRRRRGMLLGRVGLVVAVFVCASAASAQQPVTIPLSLQGNRLVIYVGVAGKPQQPYLFDTGSQIFEASQVALAGATLSGTLATGLVQPYSDSGFIYDAVTVSSLQFYASGSAPTPVASLAATGTVGGYRMGSITASYSGTYSGSSTPLTPVTTSTCVGSYSGIFGAGSFTTLASGSIVMGSILGQATTTGWVVSANGPQPTLTLGLDATLRSAFTPGTNSALYDWIAGGAPFPLSGAASSAQNLVPMNLAVQSGTTTIPWSTPTLFDTGNETNSLRPFAATVTDLQNAGAISPGPPPYLNYDVGLTVTGTAGSFAYVPKVPFMFPVQVETSGTATSAFGIDFFKTNSVLYDLQNQQVGFTTAVVPEPGTLPLLALGLGLGTLLTRRCKSVHSPSESGSRPAARRDILLECSSHGHDPSNPQPPPRGLPREPGRPPRARRDRGS